MTTFDEKEFLIGTADYDTHFWNAMRGSDFAITKIHGGTDTATGGFTLPSGSDEKLAKAVKKESIFRNLATVVKAYNGSSRIFAKDCDDLAVWVPEGGDIPIYDGVDDFTRYPVDMHKLAVFVKLDDDFVHDATFSIRDYLTDRFARNFARAEDAAFLNGTGEHMPTGILRPGYGAEIAQVTSNITFDDIIRLYFALDDEYRRNAVWMMNDDTALKLRLMKDENGNYLWNQINDTILSHPVIISNDMPDEESGSIPVIFGDFRYYWIVLRSPISVRTLKEKFVTLDQIGYLAMEFLDAKLIRREAVQAIQMVSTDPADLEG